MDDSSRVLILMLLVVTAAFGLADAQINFSTSWGKRSIVPAPESDAIVHRQGDQDPTPAAAPSTPPFLCQSLVNSLLTIRQLIAVSRPIIATRVFLSFLFISSSFDFVPFCFNK